MNQNYCEENKQAQCSEDDQDVTFFVEGASNELMIELMNRRC